jgi:hypothetical protein
VIRSNRIGLRSRFCVKHDLFRKPASTFRDHALAKVSGPSQIGADIAKNERAVQRRQVFFAKGPALLKEPPSRSLRKPVNLAAVSRCAEALARRSPPLLAKDCESQPARFNDARRDAWRASRYRPRASGRGNGAQVVHSHDSGGDGGVEHCAQNQREHEQPQGSRQSFPPKIWPGGTMVTVGG